MESLKVNVDQLERIVYYYRWEICIGLQQHVILFGDAKGVFSEIYLVDTTYYGESCEQSMFSISNK